MKEKYKTENFGQTEALGRQLARLVVPGDVIALYGPLGAGKTAFASGVLKGLGYREDITSPTFSIVNEYTGGTLDVAHIDLYRIENEEQLYATGFYDYLDGRRIVLVEWSERAPWAIPADAVRITISGSGDLPRTVHIERNPT